jgi:flagellar biosynthesis regulator FlaF
MEQVYSSLVDKINSNYENTLIMINSNHEASMQFKQEFKHDTEVWRSMHDAKQEKQNELIMALQVTIITLTANVNNLTGRVAQLEETQKHHSIKIENFGKYTIKDLFVLLSSGLAFMFMLINQYFTFKK